MPNRIIQYILAAFIIVWVCLIFADYWQKHPLYANAISNFYYWDIVVVLTIIGAGAGWLVLKRKIIVWANGFTIFALMLLLILVTVLMYIPKSNIPPSEPIRAAGIFYFLGKLLLNSAEIVCILTAAYAMGDLSVRLFPSLKLKKNDMPVIKIAIGIMALVFLLFILGAFRLLFWYTLLPIVLSAFYFARHTVLDFLKKLALQPVMISKKINAVGFAAFFILLLIVGINYVHTIAPMPSGFDALNFYVNLPNLIWEYHGLVEGFQPYNWSLFMASGKILFGQTEVMLGLSFIGGVLSLFALYRLGKGWLRININYLLAALLAFYITPAVTTQSSHELKIDLGLLFIHSIVILLFLNWLATRKKENIFVEGSSPAKQKTETNTLSYLTVIALLLGFSLGIKLTTLFLFFAIVAGIWYVYLGKYGFLMIFAASVFAVLLARLDSTIGMREYHLSAGILTWIMLAISAALLGWFFTRNSVLVLRCLKNSVVFTAIFVLPFLPWVGKNYIETKSMSINSLLNGKQPGPAINMDILEKNLNKN